jgi:hypothetical protein
MRSELTGFLVASTLLVLGLIVGIYLLSIGWEMMHVIPAVMVVAYFAGYIQGSI